MAADTFIRKTISQQLAQRSGQVSISNQDGGYQFVDDLTGKELSGQSVSSRLLANPQQPNDPKIKAQALNLARGTFSGKNVPIEMIESIATVAAYVSATDGIPVTALFPNNKIGARLMQEYNALKPKSSQIGIMASNLTPTWVNNPTLRGNITASTTTPPL